MFRLLSSLVCILFFTGCSTTSTETSPIYYQKTKPNIAFIPVKEELSCGFSWDLSHELTDEILTLLMAKNKFCLTPLIQFKPALDQTQHADYFGSDLHFANFFCFNDFLVISELTRQETVPYERERFPSLEVKRGYGNFQVLLLGMRIRVLDLRFEQPKVILQKIIETTDLVSASEAQINYQAIGPNHEKWITTPLCRCHKKLSSIIADEIESAILCNW